MEQRITSAKSSIAAAGVPFETPGAAERAEPLAAVPPRSIYCSTRAIWRAAAPSMSVAPRCEEGIRLDRLLLRLFQGEAEIMGHCCSCSTLAPARGSMRPMVPLEDQNRRFWNREMSAEALALVGKALRRKRPVPTRFRPPSPRCMHRLLSPNTLTGRRSTDGSEDAAAVARRPAQRAVTVDKVRDPAAALARIQPLAARLSDYLHYSGVKGG
jgi:RNA polymerase sigma-70 factor (ECF subfamily)